MKNIKVLALSLVALYSGAAFAHVELGPRVILIPKEGESRIEIFNKRRLNQGTATDTAARAVNEVANFLCPSNEKILGEIVKDIVPKKEITRFNIPLYGKLKITSLTTANAFFQVILEVCENNAKGEKVILQNIMKKVGLDILNGFAVEKTRKLLRPYVHHVAHFAKQCIPVAIKEHKYFEYVEDVINDKFNGFLGKCNSAMSSKAYDIMKNSRMKKSSNKE